MVVQNNLCGIGLRTPHVQEILENKINVGLLEVHAENYFGGGIARKHILQIAEEYPLSLHGVGLSLGRADNLDKEHLARFAKLVKQTQPILVSEHLSWSAYQHIHAPDLLPLPFTNEALNIFVSHVHQFQEVINRTILIENPSNYLAFADLDFTEPEFLIELCRHSGCGLLLDINNIAVSAHNLGYDAYAYLDALPSSGLVKQFHLAGYQTNVLKNSQEIYIDTHGQSIKNDVWKLYDYALQKFGDLPVLVEWDTNVPSLDTLMVEADKVNARRK
ncbi:MAG: DUF692 domain-containing protein [Pseudomonadota bacterium]